ncbi:CsgE family curli-type amyloid fiber assembly protein [Spirosoma gilvum]
MRYILLILLSAGSYLSYAQDPNSKRLLQAILNESAKVHEHTETLILDNSQSKIGRDFHDAFFQHFAEVSQTETQPDSAQVAPSDADNTTNTFIITINELPALRVGTTILTVTLNEQIIWQNYVQARSEIIELLATNAAEVVREYILNYQEIQQQLSNQEQRGNGIF